MQLKKKKEEETPAKDKSADELRDASGDETAEDKGGEPQQPDFFDLQPEEVAAFKPAGVIVAPRKELPVGTALRVLGLLVVLAGVTALVVGLWPSSNARVPDLVGKTLPEALEAARGSGLTPTVTGWAYTEDHSDGVIIEQQPVGKKLVKKGGGISLVVSKGPAPEPGNPPGQASNAGNTQSSQASAGPLSGKTVTIDPGHQAITAQAEWSDPGMTRRVAPEKDVKGVITGNEEYLVDLDISRKLKSLLEKEGIRVVVTRETSTIDLTNVIRAEIANNAASDLLVSIHCGDSSDEFMKGTDTLYPANDRWTGPIYEKSKEAALFVQADLSKACGTENLGVLDRHDMPLFTWSKVPAIEPEVGFLTSPRDDSLLVDEQFRWKVAWGLRNGIVKFLSNP